MKRIKHDEFGGDLRNFKPWNNFINSLPPNQYPEIPPFFNQRIEFINEQLKPYRAVYDVYKQGLGIFGSKDLIFETEEAYTWFVLKWS